MPLLNSDVICKIINGEYYYKDSPFVEYYHEANGKVFVRFDEIQLDNVRLANIKTRYRVFFYDCDFEGLEISKGKFINLSFNRCNISNRFIIEGGTFQHLSVQECSIDAWTVLGGRYSFFHSAGNSGVKRLEVSKGEFEEFVLYGDAPSVTYIYQRQVVVNNFKIGGNITGKIILNNATINCFTIHDALAADSYIEANSLELNQLSIRNFRNYGELKFNDIKVSRFPAKIANTTIKDFLEKCPSQMFTRYYRTDLDVNLFDSSIRAEQKNEETYYSLIIDRNSISSSFLELYKVTPGKCSFKSVDLEAFDRVKIEDTELIGIYTYDAIFPTKNVEGSCKSLYETYNDLYTAAKNKNNKREQIEYYRAAHHFLFKYYWQEKRSEEIGTIISLAVSNFYSNYGTNWLKALAVVFLLSFAFFTVLDFKYSSMIHSRNEFWAYYFQFIDPTHKLTFMDSDTIKPSEEAWFVITDLFNRIVVAIGIFEIVHAFRKFVRA